MTGVTLVAIEVLKPKGGWQRGSHQGPSGTHQLKQRSRTSRGQYASVTVLTEWCDK